MRFRNSIAFMCLCTVLAQPASADLRDLWKSLTGGADSTSKSGVAALTEDEVSAGLKQALSKGVRYAIAELGKDNGFFKNVRVKIPMPKSMRTVEKTLRKLGQDKYADEFVKTMNRAAEKSVAEAGPIFAGAIRGLTVKDSMKILNGPDNAATTYFRDKTQTQLRDKMLPIVKAATAGAGVTSAYKNLVGRLGFARGMLSDDMADIDRYVTDKAVDGLFLMIAEEEKRIRENPLARSTDLLKKVFDSAIRR